jgi:hypothetical protein
MNAIANGSSYPAFSPNLVPIFEPNQVLKDSDLNGIVTYLDSHNRITRTHLIGMGIVCGLEVQLSDDRSEIRLTPGCGITSEGFFFQYLPATGENAADLNRFTHYREEPISKHRLLSTLSKDETFQLKELISAQEVKQPNDKNILLTNRKIDLTEQVVLILGDWDNRERNSCLVDCDNRGSDRNFKLRFFLIDKTKKDSKILSAEELLKSGFEIDSLTSITSAFQGWFEVPDCQIDRLNKLDNIENFNDLIEAYYLICQDGIESIVKALKQTHQLFGPFISTFQPEATAFDTIQADLKQLLIDLVPLEEVAKKNITQVSYGTQYFYDYLVELIAAFNELKAALFDLMDECPPNMQWFPTYLLAGAVVPETKPCSPPDIYRHSFYQPPIYNGNRQRKQEVRHLYDRLMRMSTSTNFQLLPFYQTPVKITPSRSRRDLLGAQAIPYYYSYPDIYPYWNYDACRKQRAAQIPAYFRRNGLSNQRGHDLTPRIDWADFFRVEGHVGLPVRTAIAKIKQYKDEFNLAFDLVAVRVGVGIEDPHLLQGYFDDLEVEFDQIKASWQQKYATAQKIKDSNVRKILAKFNEYFFEYPDLTAIDRGLMQNDFLERAKNPDNYEFRSIDENTSQLVLNIKTERPFRIGLATNPGKETQIDRIYKFYFTNTTDIEADRTHIKRIFAADFAEKLGDLQVEIDDRDLFRFVISYGREDIELSGDDLEGLWIRIEDESPYVDVDNLIDRYHDFDALFTFLKYFGESDKILSAEEAAILVSYYEFRALFHRYLLRLESVQKMQLLTEYAKHHRGLEHLGGVPNGGTLVLVYTNEPAVISNLIATDSALINISDGQVESIQTQAQFPLDRLSIENRSQAITKDRIEQNVVIADFCLPYLCCSPYSNLNYVVAKPKPFICLPKTVYCEGDETIYDFILDPPPPLGLLKGGNGVVMLKGNYAFQPSTIEDDVTEPMNLTFFYIVDGVASSYSILLLPREDVTLTIDADNRICVLPGEDNPIYLSGKPSGGKIQLSIEDRPYQDIAVIDNLFNLGSITFPAKKDSLDLRFIYTVPDTDDYCGGTSEPQELTIICQPTVAISYSKNSDNQAKGTLVYGPPCSDLKLRVKFSNKGSEADTYQWLLNEEPVSSDRDTSIEIPYTSDRLTKVVVTLIASNRDSDCSGQDSVDVTLPPLDPTWNFDRDLPKKPNEGGGDPIIILSRSDSPGTDRERLTVKQPGGEFSGQPDGMTVPLANGDLECKKQTKYILDFANTLAGTYTLTYTLPDGSGFSRQVEVVVIQTPPG